MAQSVVEDEKTASSGHSPPSDRADIDPEIPPGSGPVDAGQDGYIDPRLEKVVLRKLDKRIPLLLAALCMLKSHLPLAPSSLALTMDTYY